MYCTGEDQSPPTKFVPPNTWPTPGPHGMAAPCKSPAQDGAGNALAPCGIPQTIWSTNGTDPNVVLPGPVTDRFYRYGGLYLDDAPDPAKPAGYFGYKSIGLGYGGTLQLRGIKGTSLSDDSRPDYSGSSWVRLAADVKPGDTQLTLDRDVKDDWQAKDELHEGDEIVLTTTDYMPTHSEELRIVGFDGKRVIKVEQAGAPGEGVRFAHVGHAYDVAAGLKAAPASFKTSLAKNDPDGDNGLVKSGETQAAVALLRRSIQSCPVGTGRAKRLPRRQRAMPPACRRIPSISSAARRSSARASRSCRSRASNFTSLASAGGLGTTRCTSTWRGRYRPRPTSRISSVSESMTRWFVIHATQGVTLQRNVGWKSIGHGYFLEDGVETDNRFYSNIGIFARPAIVSPTINPRNIPGIMASNVDGGDVRFLSDVRAPTVFWISNGWNDFVGNMAAGAGTCGSCYWLHATNVNTDMVEVPPGTMDHQTWTGYSARPGRLSPLRSFFRNSCTSAMLSFMTISDAPTPCDMVAFPPGLPDTFRMHQVPSYAPSAGDGQHMMYYPDVSGNRNPTVCPPGEDGCDVQTVNPCTLTGPEATVHCGITVLDHYTSSFNFAQTNFSAIWLRKDGWYLFDHSFLSDVQSAGLSFVTGGDYTKSSAPTGFWMLASNSVFVGATQPQEGEVGYNPWADVRGPHIADSNDPTKSIGLACKRDAGHSRCIDTDDGIGFFLDFFGRESALVQHL